MALKRLQTEYKQYLIDPCSYYSINIDEDNILLWNILLFGPSDTIFEGGIFKCQLEFTLSYPNKPPIFKFIDNIIHPNIFPNGIVCMSILHEGEDVYGYEHITERWKPSHSINSILMSFISILSEPNFNSPANVDASKLWQEDFTKYKKLIYKLITNI